MLQKQILPVLFLFLLLLPACRNEAKTAEKTDVSVKAQVTVARETLLPLTCEAAGTIQAKTAGTLAARLMGTVTTVHVTEGTKVKQGDLLVSIDDRQVAAQLVQAKAAAELAANTFARYEKLLAEASVSRQEYDEVKAKYRQAQSALVEATVVFGDASVRAPFDGVVTAKHIEAGDLASPGTPLITLEGGKGAELVAALPETLFSSVKLGDVVTLRVTAANDLVLSGAITAISPAADSQSRSFLIRVGLPDKAAVNAGMFARVQVTTGTETLMLVPQSAVLKQGQLTGLMMVDEESRARFRLIRTGRAFGDQVEVISGLSAGTRFIPTPPPTLTDGMKVEVSS